MAVATRVPDVPIEAETYGFRTTTFGTILGRSIMVEDLRQLLAVRPASSRLEDYASAVVDENVLGKPTASARRFGFRNLCEFYALDPSVRIFRALQDLWGAELDAQPTLALLCATARDPILRAVTPLVLQLPPGTLVLPSTISTEAERRFPGKFGPKTVRTLGRNVASSWEQAGLLEGRRDKERATPGVHAASVAYALLLGDLCGARGRGLFETLWARMLDAPEHTLRDQAVAASRQGWIEYRASGAVTEVTFRHLMRREGGDDELH